MKKSKIEFSKIFTPTDSIAAVVIIIGLIISIFVDQIEVRLIGVSVAILGVVALFMLISQRVKDMVNSKSFGRTVPPPDLKITHSSNSQANRQIIEDLDNSLNKDYDKVSHKKNNPDKEPAVKTTKLKVQPKDYSNGDEGFKVIRKKKTDSTPEPEINDKPADTAENKIDTPTAPVKTDKKSDNSTSVMPKAVKREESKIDTKQDKQDKHIDLFGTPEFNKTVEAPVEEVKKKNAKTAEHKPVPDIPAPKPIAPPTIEKPAKQENFGKINMQSADESKTILVDDTVSTEEPRDEFAAFVSRAMLAIRSMINTTTIAFFLVNNGKNNLLLETYVTDVPNAIIDIPKIPMGDNVISRIAQSGKPEILTEISPSAELDLLPYYKTPVGSVSFIGLPVYYNNSVLGVLCADTKSEDAYDNFTVGFFGHFAKIIASLVINFTEKYELQQAQRVLKAVDEIRYVINSGDSSLESVAEAFTNYGVEIFDFLNLGIVCFDSMSGTWKVFSYCNNFSQVNLTGAEIDIESTIIGETIRRGITLDLPIKANSPVCVHKSEDKLPKGYFVSSPIIATDTVYGALFITGKSAGHVTSYDINILNTLGEHIGIVLEQMQMKQILATTALIDPYSGILSMAGFAQRLYEEIARHKDFNIPMTLIAFKLDHYASINPEEHLAAYNMVLNNIYGHIQAELKPFDLFGKGENNIFYVALSGKKLSEAQLWAERIRSQVAGRIISVEKKKYSITLSGGVAQLNTNDSAESITGKAIQALEIARKKNNNITLFS